MKATEILAQQLSDKAKEAAETLELLAQQQETIANANTIITQQDERIASLEAELAELKALLETETQPEEQMEEK